MRVAILDDYLDVSLRSASWSALPADTEAVRFTDRLTDEDALVERLADTAFVVTMRERTPFPRSLLERLPSLRLLVCGSTHNRAIDFDAARELGITVCGTRALGYPTVELTWGLILALARKIPWEDRALRAGGWGYGVGTCLRGKTLGVIGLGRLGSQVARIGTCFQMRVLAWSQNLTPDRAEAVGAEHASKATLLAESDVISLHLTLSERTRGLIGRPELALMKASALLVNTSRGPIVDESALADALEAGALAGAALDVFDEEPLPADHRLRRLPNTILTPHIGYVSDDNFEAYYGDALECIQAYLDGHPVRILNDRPRH